MDISVEQGVDISVDFVAYDIHVFVFASLLRDIDPKGFGPGPRPGPVA